MSPLRLRSVFGSPPFLVPPLHGGRRPLTHSPWREVVSGPATLGVPTPRLLGSTLEWQLGRGLFGLPAWEVSHSVGATDDWSPRVPASVSSSELSAHQMAPAGAITHSRAQSPRTGGVVPHSNSTHEEFFVSSILLAKDGEHCTQCREAQFHHYQKSSVGNR